MRNALITLMLMTFSTGCSDVEGDDGDGDCHTHDGEEHCNEQEVIDTVELTLSGAGDVTATWTEDSADTLALAPNSTYTVQVGFLNQGSTPTEDITLEVEDESDQHQVFYQGSGLTYAYDDQDENGLPIGLVGQLTTAEAGSTTLTVTLRHMPFEDGEPSKTAGLAQTLEDEGFGALPGSNDASVTFDVTVQ